MTSISVSMIVKNEEVMLRECLETVKDADEIVIVDTGSTDGTVDIAREYTDKVYTDYKWNDHFAEARNLSLDRCTGDWVFIIDADELLLPLNAEISTMSLMRRYLDPAPEEDTAYMMHCKGGVVDLWSVRLFRRVPEIRWQGAIHNSLTVHTEKRMEFPTISLRYSPAHKLDPDRALRILTKEVKAHHKPREMFYLAREYLYRKRYGTAIYWYERYLRENPTYKPERCEAYLQLARCHFALDEVKRAIDYCGWAIMFNPNFKEALKFMAELTGEQTWTKFAEVADNSNVMFLRA